MRAVAIRRHNHCSQIIVQLLLAENKHRLEGEARASTRECTPPAMAARFGLVLGSKHRLEGRGRPWGGGMHRSGAL